MDEALWSDLRKRFRLQLSLGIFNERWNRGFGLSAEAVARINWLAAGVDVDIYADLNGAG